MFWVLCTLAQPEKVLSLKSGLAASACGCVALLLLAFLFRRFYAPRRDTPAWAFALPVGLVVLSFLVLYPLSQKHVNHRGSDREDALRVELVALRHHEYPYDARTFLGHAPTPLPGAMLLASPFFLLGHVAWQNLFWLGCFCIVLAKMYRRKATGLLFVIVFLLTAAEDLNDFDVGGDYITNILYIAVALFFFERTTRVPSAWWKTALSVILLGIALSSRIPYLLVVAPLFALTMQRRGVRTALMLLGAVLAVCLLVTVPVFLPHPLARLSAQLSQNADKFQYLPRFIPPASLLVLAAGIACVSVFLPMTLSRVYLILGLTSLVLIGVPMAAVIYAQGGFGHPVTTDLLYVALPASFLSLWIFSRLEEIALARGGARAARQDGMRQAA